MASSIISVALFSNVTPEVMKVGSCGVVGSCSRASLSTGERQAQPRDHLALIGGVRRQSPIAQMSARAVVGGLR
jgi:hypothetical protein